MALTFRSSIAEERVIIERGRDGTTRVAKARQTDGNEKMWNLQLEHPSGQKWNGTFHGNGHEVQIALTQMMMDRENDFREEAARGHRRQAPARDTSSRINDQGQSMSAPIGGFIRQRYT